MATAQVASVSFGKAIYEIVGVTSDAVRLATAHLNDPSRRGGYFCLVERGWNPMALPTLVLGVGTVPAEKGPKYLAFTQEKARRLHQHPEHRSSWQSRNPDKDEWGGAIVAGPYIFSFSGFTPDTADEAAMLLAAVELGYLEMVEALAIANRSDNQLFKQMPVNWRMPQ